MFSAFSYFELSLLLEMNNKHLFLRFVFKKCNLLAGQSNHWSLWCTAPPSDTTLKSGQARDSLLLSWRLQVCTRSLPGPLVSLLTPEGGTSLLSLFNRMHRGSRNTEPSSFSSHWMRRRYVNYFILFYFYWNSIMYLTHENTVTSVLCK